jgi:PEP-CTERM motif
MLWLLFCWGAACAGLIDPGRVVQMDPDLNFTMTLAPGERVTTYLSDSSYVHNQPLICPACPALPNYLGYSVMASVANVADTVSVSLLSYDGQVGITLGGSSLFAGTQSSVDSNGNVIQIPISLGSLGSVSTDATQQALLFSDVRFRADLTNTSKNAISTIQFNIGLTGLSHIGPSTSAFSASANAAAIFVPEPGALGLLGIGAVAFGIKGCRASSVR